MTGWQRSIAANRFPTRASAAAGSLARGLAAAVAFAILTWVGANVYVPLEPVPVTLQTLFVLLAGSAIGGRYGALSQSMYVAAGAVGLPVFAGGAAGWGILAGPTGGYLVAFLVTPLVVSRLLRGSTSVAVQVFAFTAGTLVIFVLGISHLALFYTHDVGAAVRVGLLPFIPGTFIKIAAALSVHRGAAALSRHVALRRGA